MGGGGGEYLNAVLKCPGIVWVREFDDRELVGPLQVLHPLVGLAWRRRIRRAGQFTYVRTYI